MINYKTFSIWSFSLIFSYEGNVQAKLTECNRVLLSKVSERITGKEMEEMKFKKLAEEASFFVEPLQWLSLNVLSNMTTYITNEPVAVVDPGFANGGHGKCAEHEPKRGSRGRAPK